MIDRSFLYTLYIIITLYWSKRIFVFSWPSLTYNLAKQIVMSGQSFRSFCKNFSRSGEMNQLWNSKYYVLCVCLCSCLSWSACISYLFCAILYYHLWPVWFYHIFPHYLINGLTQWSLDGTAGSNTAGGMDVCLLWVLCVVSLCAGLISCTELSYRVWWWSLDNREDLEH